MTVLNPDPLVVSLVQVASYVPLFLLALPAGALTDLIDRRKLLLFSELAIMAFGVVLAALVSSQLITPVSLIVMTALVSAAGAVGAPPWQAVVSDLVPRSDLPSAVSLNSLGINISRAVGPALGGSAGQRVRLRAALLDRRVQQRRRPRGTRVVEESASVRRLHCRRNPLSARWWLASGMPGTTRT